MADLKTIAAIVGIGGGLIGILGPLGTYFVSITHLQDAVAALEKSKDGERTELNSMHERENTLATGIVAAQNEVNLARSDISGKLALLISDLQHIKETLAEVRDAQKHPSSSSGTGQ